MRRVRELASVRLLDAKRLVESLQLELAANATQLSG
jgi:hypothetical protein